MFETICIFIMLVSVALVLSIIVQKSKGGGLASNMAGVNSAVQLFGSRKAAENIEKVTWFASGIIALLCILASFAISGGEVEEEGSTGLRSAQAIEIQRPNTGATAAPDMNQLGAPAAGQSQPGQPAAPQTPAAE
jgi:preprotein translocase subunit SecG